MLIINLDYVFGDSLRLCYSNSSVYGEFASRLRDTTVTSHDRYRYTHSNGKRSLKLRLI